MQTLVKKNEEELVLWIAHNNKGQFSEEEMEIVREAISKYPDNKTISASLKEKLSLMVKSKGITINLFSISPKNITSDISN